MEKRAEIKPRRPPQTLLKRATAPCNAIPETVSRRKHGTKRRRESQPRLNPTQNVGCRVAVSFVRMSSKRGYS